MKQIQTDFKMIDQGLFSLQEMLAKISSCEKQYNQDISERKKKIELAYVQTLEQIEKQRKQVEANCVQALARCKQMRADTESENRRLCAESERQIQNRCEDIIRRNKQMIAWLEQSIAEMPTKMVKKVVSGPTINPCYHEKRSLEELYAKIFDGSFRASINRTFQIDGYSLKAKMIQAFLENAIAYKLYLENEIEQANAKRSSDINMLYRRAQAKKQRDLDQIAQEEKRATEDKTRSIQDLDNKKALAAKTKMTALDAVEQQKAKYDSDLTAKRKAFQNNYSAYMNSGLIMQYMDRRERKLVGTGASAADWQNYDAKETCAQYYFGDIRLPIRTQEPRLVAALGAKLPKVFAGGMFGLPLLMNAEQAMQMFVYYQQSDKKQIYEFVQSVVLQKLRCAKAGNVKLYFAEPDVSGLILGPLSGRIQDNENIGIYNINSKDAIKTTLKQFVEDIQEINGLLGSYADIFEYNRNCVPAIKERCLIMVDVGGVLDKDDWEQLKAIWNNGAKCGMTTIIVSAYTINEIPSLYPHMNIDVSYLNSTALRLVSCINNKTTIQQGQSKFAFSMTKLTDACKEFVDKYKKEALNSQKVDSGFANYFDAEKAYPYKDSTEKLVLPILVRNYPGGGLLDFVMDSKTRAHTLLTGGTGSGKTTFLYMLISSIVMNYHPDDVELWLVDYGRVSFKRYVNKRPKHVRFVSLEKTETFTYSFLEYVDEYFRKRSELFKKDNVDNIAEYRALHGPQSMPRIVIIVDEFHNMPQHAKESPMHNKILENILREYRKYGLSCIFSDQTRNTGLTEDGEKQIANRLAMRQNNIVDIIDTIGVAKSNYDEEKLRQMERTQQGELWAKSFYGESDNDFEIGFFKVVYADAKQQEQVLETSLKRNDTIQFDTKVYIVDGEERKKLHVKGLQSMLLSAATTEPMFCLGVPTSIEPFFAFQLEQRHSNNILVAGRNANISSDVLTELLLSAALNRNVRTIVFADPRERRLFEIEDLLHDVGIADKVEIYTDYESICGLVKKFSDQLVQRKTLEKPTVIMWLGVLDIYDELVRYGEYKEQPEGTQEGFELSSEKANVACADEELIAQAEALGISVEDMLNMLGIASEPKPVERVENGCIYNAIRDINLLLAVGSRSSLYNIVPLENSSDIKRLKDFNLDNFIHKIGYMMSDEDSWAYGFGKRASTIPSGDIAVYTDGKEYNMFRPFLLK